MSEVPAKYMRQIRRYAPVEVEGICLYPVTVDEYDLFSDARPAIEFVQQSLPVTYVSMPLLQAYYELDFKSVADKQLPTGLMTRALLFLALALRLGAGDSPEKRISRFRIRTRPDNPRKLDAVLFSLDGEEIHEITPARFQRLVPILAAQNGIKLHEDTDNPELLAAEEQIERKNQLDVDANIDLVVTSVAAMSGCDEADIYDWPILKLQNRQRALKMAMDYIICGVGETQGTKWKHGNPCPSPFFPLKKSGSVAAIPIGEFAGGAAQDAVNNAMQS